MLILSPTVPPVDLRAEGPDITVLAASHAIAQKYSIPEAEVKRKLAEALATEELFVRNQARFTYEPESIDISVERISIQDLNCYLESIGSNYWLDESAHQCHVGDRSNAEDPTASQVTQALELPRRKVDIRIEKILLVLKDNGINIMSIPRGEKKNVKALCLKQNLRLFTSSEFDAAWKEASKSGKLRVENCHKYRPINSGNVHRAS